jgi:DeoR/GlpR family transcriptional regulator of sugar metabolism
MGVVFHNPGLSRVIPAQRRREILRLITTQGVGSITELSHLYNVSEMTIRRDLKTLEQEGFVVYAHGGAIAAQPGILQSEPAYLAKKLRNIDLKTRIARYAATRFVEDHDIIILEAGTTVMAMVPFLANKEHLTVVTNGLYTTTELRSILSSATVICTGGILRDTSFTFVGSVAEGFFREFYARKLFLSGLGFTFETGLTDPQMIDTQVKKSMIASSDRVIVLLDSSKFGVKSFTTIIRPGEIDVVITDDGVSPAVVDELQQAGIEVHVVS